MKNKDLMLTEAEITDAVKHIQYPIPSWWLDIIKLELQAQLSKILNAGYKSPGETRKQTEKAVPQEDELPTIDQFVGSDPGYTGDMTTERYIRGMRSG